MPQESPKIPKLTTKQLAFIEAWKIIPFRTQELCAETAGVRADTVTTWKHTHPDFWPACGQARAEAVRAIAPEIDERISLAAGEAFEKKLELLRSKQISPYVLDQVATWLLERVVGKTPDRIEHTGKDGEAIQTAAKVVIMVPPKDEPPAPGDPPSNEGLQVLDCN